MECGRNSATTAKPVRQRANHRRFGNSFYAQFQKLGGRKSVGYKRRGGYQHSESAVRLARLSSLIYS